MVLVLTFVLAAAVCLGGAAGVVLMKNPVHNALSLVATLFGVAVLFIAQGAYFLAAVQVIVYAGAIVVLFLFVIMLLGVDRTEELHLDRNPAERILAIVVAVALAALSAVVVLAGKASITGEHGSGLRGSDLNGLAEQLFTRYVWVFEITSGLLAIGVIGAVLLSRTPKVTSLDSEAYDELASELGEPEQPISVIPGEEE